MNRSGLVTVIMCAALAGMAMIGAQPARAQDATWNDLAASLRSPLSSPMALLRTPGRTVAQGGVALVSVCRFASRLAASTLAGAPLVKQPRQST